MLRQLIDTYKNTGELHHAYLIEGDKESIISALLNFLEKDLNFSYKNNSDFWHGEYETFGIDDGRKINELQSKKAFSEISSDSYGMGKQIFIINTNFITREAQNSLLKMFEEPTPDTHFFVVMNSSEVLLPTLKSRLMTVKNFSNKDTNKEGKEFAENFVKSPIAKRFEIIKVFFGDTKNKIPADKSGAINFLNNLEKNLREEKDFLKLKRKEITAFEEISKARSYLNDRSPSVKMILEHISIII